MFNRFLLLFVRPLAVLRCCSFYVRIARHQPVEQQQSVLPSHVADCYINIDSLALNPVVTQALDHLNSDSQ